MVLCMLISANATGKNRDVCEMRADIVKRIAEQRDNGAPKVALKKAMSKSMPQFPSYYIDLIWQHRELSPRELWTRDFELCLKTP